MAASSATVLAQRPWPDADLREGKLSFDGKATLGDFTGVTTAVRGHLTGGARIQDTRGWVEAAVATLKTGNDHRDHDLRKSMEADLFPTIRFQLEGVEPEWERADSAGVVLAGQFFIHGVTRQERISALVVRSADSVRVTASLPMDLHDYKIGGLTRFLVFKMNPNTVVHIDVSF